MANGFDFSAGMRAVCCDMVRRLPQLAHIRMGEVAVAVSQARKDSTHGVYATLTPLRFAAGAETTVRNGVSYRMQRVLDQQGRDYLYILSFYLPRFLDRMDFHEKVATILHELWHVSPQFNGDVRRFPGRYYVHSGSEQEYDERMRRLAREWLARRPPAELYAFLECDFRQLQQRFGAVSGIKPPRPRLLRIGRAHGDRLRAPGDRR